jgi:mono/diheme cytochrome c family protein
LKDSAHKVADQFAAMRTPTVFVLDEDRRIRYQGRIDDQYGAGYARSSPTTNDLAGAIDELLAGKPVSTPTTTAVGCHIGRRGHVQPTGDVTYAGQIAGLLDRHCVNCHRPGQIAPFALTDYDDVAAWAETICEVLAERRMPPWHASPAYGHFANDRHMTDAERELFRKWVDNGMPPGDEKERPERPTFSEGWQIPEPDAVYKMPQAFTVPAKGVIPYQRFTFDPGFKEDVWIQGAEVRPGCRSVVHHMFAFFLPPGQEKPRAEDPIFNTIATFAPGIPAGLLPAGFARLVPAGSKLMFEIHYTPNGSEQSDQSEVGIVFADPKTVKKEVKIGIAVNQSFRIPPGAPDYHVAAGYSFTQDTVLRGLAPHMHYRGKSFRFTARYPGGGEEILLDVPRYDFNWQNVYELTEPKLMPKGTVLMCAGTFDNSADNPANPDATKEVVWGEQSWDEMMLGSFVTSLPDWSVRSEFPKITRVGDDAFDVTFQYQPPEGRKPVQSVCLAGTFNKWAPKVLALTGPDEMGRYRTTLRLKPGQYEYKFVVNGTEWTHDPGNPDQNGPFSNSVVSVREVKKD